MKFNLIIADPPWQFTDRLTMSKVKRGAESQYKSILSYNDILNLKIKEIAEDNAIMALWVPSALIDIGLESMKNYGFNYKQTFIWVKSKNEPLLKLKKQIKKALKAKDDEQVLELIDNFDLNDTMKCYLGRMFRQTHEVALIGTRGKTSNDRLNKSQISVYFGNNPKHSEKPYVLHERLEKMYPNYTKKLEIFGRRDYQDWVVLGNELQSEFNGDVRDSIEKLIKL